MMAEALLRAILDLAQRTEREPWRVVDEALELLEERVDDIEAQDVKELAELGLRGAR